MAPSVVKKLSESAPLKLAVRLDRGIEQNYRGAKVDSVVAFLDTPEIMCARGDDSSAKARQRFLSRAGTERSDDTMLDTSSNKPNTVLSCQAAHKIGRRSEAISCTLFYHFIFRKSSGV